MTIPIPSGIVPIPMTDIRRSTDIQAPSAPVGISGVGQISPRQALMMPEPVVTADQASLARQSLERNFQENLTPNSGIPGEPTVSQAALLEISNQAPGGLSSQQSSLNTAGGIYANNAILNQQDLSGNLDQNLLSTGISNLLPSNLGITSSQVNTLNTLIAEVVSQSQANLMGDSMLTPAQLSTMTVAWPSGDAAQQSQAMSNALLANDPKAIFTALKSDLQSSGIFAAEQLAHVLMPAMEASATTSSSPSATSSPASAALINTPTPQQLMQQLDPNSSSLVDAIRLALKGNLFWEGMLANQVPAKITREDAWETSSNDPTQVIKGTRISVALNLPKLGPMTVVGTEFNDQINLSIQVGDPKTQSVFQDQLIQLQDQLKKQLEQMPALQLTTGVENGK
jgi:hypothetical protein